MLWVHLSPGPPPRALSHLNSEKSEHCAPLFASDHISHLNLDHISYRSLDDISHLNSESISFLNLKRKFHVKSEKWIRGGTHTNTFIHTQTQCMHARICFPDMRSEDLWSWLSFSSWLSQVQILYSDLRSVQDGCKWHLLGLICDPWSTFLLFQKWN